MTDFPTYEQVRNTLPKKARVGQMFMPAAFIHDTDAEVARLEALIRDHAPGGLCFFHSRASAAANFGGSPQERQYRDSLKRLKDLIHRYQEIAPYPLLIAMDAEWGLAMRVEDTPAYPFAIALGAVPDSGGELLYQVGLSIGRDCREAGVHWNLAPVVDINTDPDNPVIGYRAFGHEPAQVLRCARQVLRGMADAGVPGCLKHFPGHGDTAVDSHLDLPVLPSGPGRLEKVELLPFRELIREGVPAVMTGHLAVPALDASGLPASLSAKMIGYLRKTLGFEGVVVTDALNMHALHRVEARAADLNLRAVAAGNDLLCFADQVPESTALILDTLPESRIEASFRRIWRFKEQVFQRKIPAPAPTASWEALNRKVAGACTTEIGQVSGSLPAFRQQGYALWYHGERPEAFIRQLGDAPVAIGIGPEAPMPGCDSRNIVLALTPPGRKPAPDFGLPASFPDQLEALCRKHRVLLYLFGNPYLLRKLPVASLAGVVCAFQPLEGFQETAADHFLGKLPARGNLSIPLSDGY